MLREKKRIHSELRSIVTTLLAGFSKIPAIFSVFISLHP